MPTRSVLWLCLSLGGVVLLTWLWLKDATGGNHDPIEPVEPQGSYRWQPPEPLNAQRAWDYLDKICKLGSRTSGTQGMQEQQTLLESHFKKLGATVQWQPFTHRHPETGQAVELKNLIVQWNPQKTSRVMICTHYDTRPFPVWDAKNPRGLFIGANDGASGTGLLMELGHAMSELHIEAGVDFVFFDAEEWIFTEQRDPYFVGSEYFAHAYADQIQKDPNAPRYSAGVLIDMIGDADLQLYYEKNSFSYAKSLTTELWDIAKRLKIKEFEPRIVHEVRDDHLALNNIAGIPTVDIIDFDYPRRGARGNGYWHTTADTPDKCSGTSMVKVGAVLLEWIRKQP